MQQPGQPSGKAGISVSFYALAAGATDTLDMIALPDLLHGEETTAWGNIIQDRGRCRA